MTNLDTQELTISKDDKRWEILYKILLAEYKTQEPQVSLTIREMGHRMAMVLGQDASISSSVIAHYLKKLKDNGYIDFPKMRPGVKSRDASKIILKQV